MPVLFCVVRRIILRETIILFFALFLAATAVSSSAQSFTTLATFDQTNGWVPGALTLGSDGNFYGTTADGGNLSYCGGDGCGTIFKVTPSGVLTSLYSFTGVEGLSPEPLVQGSDGNFYGTTPCSSVGGADRRSLPQRKFGSAKSLAVHDASFCYGFGNVFRISPSGTFVLLHAFNGNDGSFPFGALILGSDGNFYGTTALGGAYNFGTVYKMTPSGAVTTLHSFTGVDGNGPQGGLVQASDGNFYGTAGWGGANNDEGTVFKITPSGTFTSLHSFNAKDGQEPNGNLIQAADGNFYGTTYLGGANNNCNPETACGTVFKMTPNGTVTTFHDFSGTDGANPNAGLVQGSDGSFYGTTTWFYNGGPGTVFRLTPTGILSTLHYACSENNCADGVVPAGPLAQGPGGLLYGSTQSGGNVDGKGDGYGTIFSTSASSAAYQFVPIEPCRLFDTRWGNPIPGGTAVLYAFAGCGDLSSATAYSFNVTVVPRGHLGYLTIWPFGENQPIVSLLNSPDGRVKATAAIIAAGQGLYQNVLNFYASNTTDVILDLNGYFTAPGSQTLQFYPLTPCRIIDTRNGQDQGTLQAGVERDYAVTGKCGLPGTAQAYSFNVTAIPARGGLDYLTVWPQGLQLPIVSTLNDDTGTVVANAAIVPAGNNQTIAFYPHNNNTDLVLDVNGYFAPPGSGGNSLYTVPPCRIYDSRNNNGQPFTGERTVPVAGNPCVPPSAAAAYVFNATVVPSGRLPYLTLWGAGEQEPPVSTLNAYDGFITSNMAIVANGSGSIDADAVQGSTQLILDIAGYFAP